MTFQFCILTTTIFIGIQIQNISSLTFSPLTISPLNFPKISELFHKCISIIPKYSPQSFAEGNIPFITRQNLWKPREPINQTTLYIPENNQPSFGIQYPVWYAFKKIQNIPEKTRHFARLMRIQNICPLIAASITSGWVIHPTIPQSIQHLRSSKFAIAVINILLIMSASMIINDLYDIPIDMINNPYRPLVSGKITIPEAKGAICILLAISEILVIQYLPIHAQIGNHVSILGVLLYTHYLKRMFVIKNLFCAGLIAYSLIFAGLANSVIMTFTEKNRTLFITMFSVIFANSFQKEVLLDILDYEGDKANHIPTFATKYGRYNAFLITYIGITLSVFLQSWVLLGLYGPIAILFSYIMIYVSFLYLIGIDLRYYTLLPRQEHQVY